MNIQKSLSFKAFSLILLSLFATSGVFAETKSVVINVSVTVAPLFELSVAGPANGNIEFGFVDKDPNGPVTIESKEVVLNARTNKGTPYQITQALVNPLANESGAAFQDGELKSYATGKNGGSVVSQGGEVTTSPSELYRSSSEGKSDTISAKYRLTVPTQQEAGAYTSKLIYTITTL